MLMSCSVSSESFCSRSSRLLLFDVDPCDDCSASDRAPTCLASSAICCVVNLDGERDAEEDDDEK